LDLARACADMSDDEPIGRRIGRNVTRLFEMSDFDSHTKLATACGLSQPTMSQLLAGGTLDPPIGSLLKICAGLGVSLDDLLEDIPENPKVPSYADQVAGLRADVADQKAETADSKAEIAHLKAEMASLMAELSGLKSRLAILELGK
jgi:transcriptional regulator with XRE-family HTH domain